MMNAHREIGSLVAGSLALTLAMSVVCWFSVHATASVERIVAVNSLAAANSLRAGPEASRQHELSGWENAAPMSVGRTRFTMTELREGRVLVAGGRISHFPRAVTNTVEIYLPHQGIWQAAASMNIARENFTATLLNDGRVLVAGGRSFVGGITVVEASTEIYDPGTGTWVATGSMAQPRFQHGAALLHDGRVLVAGGFAFGLELNAAEIYDPKTGQWSAASPMSEARQAPTATLLKDGRVLLAGGFSSCCSLASTETYDPRTNSWSSAGMMSQRRGSFDAVLLKDGRVLIAGGLNADETLFESMSSAELYNPRRNSWHRIADMSESRIDAELTVLRNGQVLVSGGFQTPDFSSIAHTEILDVHGENWMPAGSLNVARGSHLSQLLFDGSVLVVGGDPNADFPTATTEIFRRPR